VVGNWLGHVLSLRCVCVRVCVRVRVRVRVFRVCAYVAMCEGEEVATDVAHVSSIRQSSVLADTHATRRSPRIRRF
jgi:hypothetical protein